MAAIASAHFYINGSDANQVTIILPRTDPSEPVTANTMIRISVTLSGTDVAKIGADGTYYDLRVRLLEEDNSILPWGDDTDDLVWEVRTKLHGIPSETVEIRQDPFIHTLEHAGHEFYAEVTLYRRNASQMTELDKQRTNTINLLRLRPRPVLGLRTASSLTKSREALQVLVMTVTVLGVIDTLHHEPK